MADDTIGVLKQLLEQAKQGNLRLESVEKGLSCLEGRFGEISSSLNQYVERLDVLTRRQTDSELRLAEVLSLADVTREVRHLLS